MKSLMMPVVLALAATAYAQDVPGYLKKDAVELADMLEGVWDNDRQVFFAEDAGMDTARVAARQNIVISRADLAGTPEGVSVLKARRTLEGEDNAVLYHVFDPVPAAGAIRHRFAIAGEDFARLQFVEDCTAMWKRKAGGFSGWSMDEGCRALFPRPDGEGPAVVSMTLSQTEFEVEVERDGQVVEASFRRARPFTCWVAVLPGAEHGESGEGRSDWDFRQGIAIHDQGGEARVESGGTNVRLKLRDVDWPYGTRRPSLTLYVYEGDSDRAVSYVWTGGGEDRIGINLRWVQASCTADD